MYYLQLMIENLLEKVSVLPRLNAQLRMDCALGQALFSEILFLNRLINYFIEACNNLMVICTFPPCIHYIHCGHTALLELRELHELHYFDPRGVVGITDLLTLFYNSPSVQCI